MADTQPDKFQFTLDVRGVDSEVLPNAPVDWEKTTITYKRSVNYEGILKNLSLPFQFNFRGAYLLRNEFYQFGQLSNVKLLIDKLNPSTRKYKNIYKGKLDFSQFEDELKRVTVPATQDDLSLRIAAFDSVKYQIPLNVPEAIDVLLTPIKLKEKADFIYSPNTDYRSDAFWPLVLVNNEQHATVASVQDKPGFLADSTPDFTTSNEWFYRATTNTQIRLFGNLKGFVFPNASGDRHFGIEVYSSTGALVYTIYDVTLPSAAPVGFDINYDFTLDMDANERLYIYFKNFSSNNTNVGFQIETGDLSLAYNTETPATHCKALRASYVFDRLIQLMNGDNQGGAYDPYPTQSFLLSGILNNLVITSSNAIRQIPPETRYLPGDTLSLGSRYTVVNAPIIYNSTTYQIADTFMAVDNADTFSGDGAVVLVSFNEYLLYSFKDFYQSVKSVMGGDCSFGLDNGAACLENLSYVYRNLTILNVGANRTGFKLSVALDKIYNSIKIGYQDQQYDSLNGTQETNSEQSYTVAITTNKELNLVSETRADCYGIEQIRVTPTDTAASRSDNDNFFIWIKDNPEAGQTYYQPLRSDGLISITGVDGGDSFYNWMLTPKRNLLRGGAYLASIFYGLKGYKIRFESAFKNYNLVTIGLDGVVVSERDDVLISSLPQPIFIPYNVEFSTDLPKDTLDFIDTKYYGAVGFIFNNYAMKGFIIEASVDAGQNSTRDYKLLLTPDNNLQMLIR